MKYIPDADALYAYGGGEGGIFFSHIQCTGNESRLEYCIGNIAVNCSHDQDAGVKCADGELTCTVCWALQYVMWLGYRAMLQ